MGTSSENVFLKKPRWNPTIRAPAQVGKLLRLHPDRAHELPPLLHLRRAVGARFGERSARLRVDADVRELLLELRVLRDFRERGVQAIDDGLGSAGCREDRVPGPYVEAGQF